MKNMKMTGKILFTFGIMLLMAAIIAGTGLASVNKVDGIAKIYANTTLPAVEELWSARRAVQAVEKYAMEATVVMTSAELSEVESKLVTERETIDTSLNEFVALAPQYQSQVDQIKTDLNTATTIRQQIMTEAWKFTAEANARAYEIYKDSFVPTYAKVIEGLKELQNNVNDAILVRHQEAQVAKKVAVIMVVIALLLMVAIIVVFVKVLDTGITKPIRKVERILYCTTIKPHLDCTINIYYIFLPVLLRYN